MTARRIPCKRPARMKCIWRFALKGMGCLKAAGGIQPVIPGHYILAKPTLWSRCQPVCRIECVQ